MNSLKDKKPIEAEAVALANTVSNPRAVMVKGRDTVVANFAMLAPQRLLDVAHCAVFVFYKENDAFAVVV